MTETRPLAGARARGLRRDLVSESAIYGLILVSALLIVVSRGEQSSWDTFLKVSGTVVVFWVAHVFAHIVARLSSVGSGSGEAGEFRSALRHALAHSTGLLLAAIVPLAIIFAGVLKLINGDTATWAALWVDVALLGLLGYFGSAGWTKRRSLRIVASAVTALLGVSIMLLKALIH
ncbi:MULTISPECIES: hypothetical protein [unclassified Leucobacter]|uniref:hypothetical protein n=1 Tax=unclassified Leucobacter TaxID=2621730 RepID=UPI00165D49D6|nr:MULTISPECIES: hypothetical protein [unclassified Leucobacter]MBC9937584.1 hypothetical protein [Leucobacter sp. cx-87]